ncbi:ATP-binding cassette domain-containing protein, partial [uncultured Aeromicrobium sp.]|uniref:ATP-binding cassette domain-containing protein n=1 Tax=uncultured Aeromicrobium sp. TaxID=337820 RepID=UPI0025D5C37D
MTNPPLVEVDHVTKTFGDRRALDDVTITIARGELVGLLGPNGAGKSTLISLLTGLRRPSSGSVRFRGGDPRDPATRVALGTTPQQTGLPETLTVGEVTQFVARHYPEPADADELLERFGLA